MTDLVRMYEDSEVVLKFLESADDVPVRVMNRIKDLNSRLAEAVLGPGYTPSAQVLRDIGYVVVPPKRSWVDSVAGKVRRASK